MDPNNVKAKLKKTKRPMTVRFARPISKSLYQTITTPNGEKKTKKWGDSDVESTIGSLPCRTIYPFVLLTFL